MPERFIIHRFTYKDTLAQEWWEKFCALSDSEVKEVKDIVARNHFTEDVIGAATTPAIAGVLEFYVIRRDS